MRIGLVTLGHPATPTGGYLYHRRMAHAAPEHGASMEFLSLPTWPFPLPVAAGRSVVTRLESFDVAVLDSIAAAFVAPWLQRLGRPPVVGMLHQPPGGIDHRPLRARVQALLDLKAYSRLARVMVASRSLADELSEFGVPAGSIVVVPPGRDVAGRAEAVGDLRQGRAAALLCVGNWIPRKGILDLLEAFTSLPQSLAALHLVGDVRAATSYGRKVRARVEELGGAPRVVVHGAVSKERVAGFYRAADVFVLPSTREPYGTVYGEAMAEGLPVVGWDAGNLPYLARDGVEGLVVGTGDRGALSRALFVLSSDERLRRQMGRAARRRARSLPTWDETATAFFGILRAAVGAP